MATRYSKVIQLLEEGKPVFGTGLIWNGNLDEMMYFADSDYDSGDDRDGARRVVLQQPPHFPPVPAQPQARRRGRRPHGRSHPRGAHPAQHPRAEPVGHQAGPGHRRLRPDPAPPGHRGRSHVGGAVGALSAGARRARLRAPRRARLVAAHRAALLGPFRRRILRRRRPVAPGPRWEPAAHGHRRGAHRRPEPARHPARGQGHRRCLGRPRATCRWHWGTRATPAIPRYRRCCFGSWASARKPECPALWVAPPRRFPCGWSRGSAS